MTFIRKKWTTGRQGDGVEPANVPSGARVAYLKWETGSVNVWEDHPKKTIKTILKKMIHIIETNPIIGELYIGSNMEEMLKRLSSELLEKHFIKDFNALLTLVEKWRSLGIHVKEDPTVIAGLLRSLFVLTLHEKEIGTSVYKESMNLFVDLIVDGLIKEE